MMIMFMCCREKFWTQDSRYRTPDYCKKFLGKGRGGDPPEGRLAIICLLVKRACAVSRLLYDKKAPCSYGERSNPGLQNA